LIRLRFVSDEGLHKEATRPAAAKVVEDERRPEVEATDQAGQLAASFRRNFSA
jgi:hypothetical protein